MKAIVVGSKGKIIYDRSLAYDLYSPKPGYAEEDALVWRDSMKKLITDITLSVDKNRIGAIGITGMVPTLILLDEDFNPLYHSIQQNDARASLEITEYKSEIDEESYFLQTGNTVNQQVIFPKYRWFEKYHPELIEKTRHIMGSYNYCTYCLTGKPTLEMNWALESGMWLIREKKWFREILKKSNI